MFDLEDRGHVHTSPAHGHNVSLNTSPHNRYDVAGATCCGYTARYVEDTMTDEARGTRHTHSVVGGVSNAAPATDASPASAVAPYVQILVCRKD